MENLTQMRRFRTLLLFLLALPLAAQDSHVLKESAGVRLDRHAQLAENLTPPPQKPNVHVVVTRRGKTVLDYWTHNLRTNGGTDMQAAQMATTGSQPAACNYGALSNDSASPAAGDCAAGATSCTLASEIVTNGLARAQMSYAHTSGTNVITLTYTWTATGAQAAQKAGLFNAASSGVMCLEFAFPQRSLQTGDTLQLTWTENI